MDVQRFRARHGLIITSTEDEVRIVAKKKITLNAADVSYITLDQSRIEAGTLGDTTSSRRALYFWARPSKYWKRLSHLN